MNHLVQYREVMFDEVKDDIKMQFGGFEDTETYIYKTYLQHMMKDRTWCDLVALKAIASMWAAKLTVIAADTFYQTRVRHDGPCQGADICVLFNGNYVLGHYISCLKVDGSHFIIGIPEEEPGYNRWTDRVERKGRADYDWRDKDEEELAYLTLSQFMELRVKADKYDKMKSIAEEGLEENGGDLPPLPTLDPDEEQRRRDKKKKKDDSRKRKQPGDGDDDEDDNPGGGGDPGSNNKQEERWCV